jgi:hypothetical protein
LLAFIESSAAVNRPVTPPSCKSIQCFETPVKTINPTYRYIGDIRTPHLSMPRKAKKVLQFTKGIIEKQQKKIRTLQRCRGRLIARIKTLKELVTHLKQKNLLSNTSVESNCCYSRVNVTFQTYF